MPQIPEILSRIDILRRSDRVCFGDVTYGPGGTCGPRIQSDFQLVVVVTGSATIEFESSSAGIQAGQAILLRPDRSEMIRFNPIRTTRHVWCAVHPSWIDISMTSALRKVVFPEPAPKSLKAFIDCGLGAADERLSPPVLDHLGLALMAHCLEWSRSGHAGTVPPSVQRAKALIDTRFPEPLSLSDMAREAGTTINHLIRLFRQHCGTTPARYLWQIRTRHGIELLVRTGLSVSEIAERTGFANPFHFSRMIRKATGQSPKMHRRTAWQEPDRPSKGSE